MSDLLHWFNLNELQLDHIFLELWYPNLGTAFNLRLFSVLSKMTGWFHRSCKNYAHLDTYQGASFSSTWHGTTELRLVCRPQYPESPSSTVTEIVFPHPLFIWLLLPRSSSLCAPLLSCIFFFSYMYESFWMQNLLASLLPVPHSWWLSVNSVKSNLSAVIQVI